MILLLFTARLNFAYILAPNVTKSVVLSVADVHVSTIGFLALPSKLLKLWFAIGKMLLYV